MKDGTEGKEQEQEQEVTSDDIDFPGEDRDDVELAEAKAALAEEEAGTDDSPPTGEEPAKTEPQPEAVEPSDKEPAAAASEGEPEKPAQIMIPKERLDEALRKNDLSAQGMAYWQGRAESSEAAAAKGQPGAEPQTAEPTPAEKIQKLRDEKLALAAKFDDGELSMLEHRKQEMALNDQEDVLKASLMAPPKQPQPVQPAGDNLYLAERTNELSRKHPYVEKITGDANWRHLEMLAREQLGDTIHDGDLGSFQVREKMAQLTDAWGPVMTGEQPAAAASSGDGQQQPASPSDIAEARRKKLELAGKQPPDINALGQGGGQTPEVTAAQVEAMTDEELDALPQATRDKLMAGV